MIYSTPYYRDENGMQHLAGVSEPTDFASTNDVRDVMGVPLIEGPLGGVGWLVYGDETDRVVFSRLPFGPTVDEPVTSDA